MLAYLARYTHRVAISNRALDEDDEVQPSSPKSAVVVAPRLPDASSPKRYRANAAFFAHNPLITNQ
jgi:hypothetical protein